MTLSLEAEFIRTLDISASARLSHFMRLSRGEGFEINDKRPATFTPTSSQRMPFFASPRDVNINGSQLTDQSTTINNATGITGHHKGEGEPISIIITTRLRFLQAFGCSVI